MRKLFACPLLALVSGLALPASAAPTVQPYSIFTPVSVSVYNDRIGNSRFFGGPNTDRVRTSAFVSPSPDTDVFVFTGSNGNTFISNNGADTTVAVTHPSFTGERELTFVGLTSGSGGGRNEYTRSFDRASPNVSSRLDAWDATPFTFVVRNPRAANGVTEVQTLGVDFDKNAMPPFVTDVSITGNGLNPTIAWAVPDSSIALTNISIQVRRIEAVNSEGTRITAATLVHSKLLDITARNYTFNEVFSNAGLAGFPSGLEMGKNYEISVQIDTRQGSVFSGRSRTFFEMTPLASGGTGVQVFLPSVGPDGRFKFDVEVQAGERVLIDPIVAIGYDYEIGAGDPLFRSVSLPDIGDGLFELWLWDANDVLFKATDLAHDTEYFFDGGGVSRFRVLGIEPSAGVDPNSVTAFVTQLRFAGTGRFTGTMTPITIDFVPEPPAWALALPVMIGLLARRRRAGAPRRSLR